MDYARIIDEIEREKDRKRMLARNPGESTNPVPHGAQGSGKRRNAISAKYIVANAVLEIIGQLDRGERAICGTYKIISQKDYGD